MYKDALILIFAFVATFTSLWYISPQRERNALKTHENKQISSVLKECACKKKETGNWNAFINALVWVESKGKWDAIGSDGDVGVLQIEKVMVDECNRIVGYKHFEYEDRLDSIKSVQMFNVVQKYYNPKKNIHLALKIWNSKASLNYHKQVEKRYNEICNNK